MGRFYQDFFIAGIKGPCFLRAADHHGRLFYTTNLPRGGLPMIKTRTKSLHRLILIASMSLMTPSVFAAGAASAPSAATAAKASAGAIVGRLTNAAKLPIAGATITAVRADGGAIRATISGSGGVYSFGDLPPGVWSLILQVERAPDLTAASLQVAPSQDNRH